MAIKLAANECVMGQYEYSNGTVKAKGKKKIHVNRSLIITNKRVINEFSTDTTIEREEIPVTAATYLASSYRAVKRPLILLILGLWFLIGGIICLVIGLKDMILIPIIVGAACGVLGLILLVAFLRMRNATTVSIIIATDRMVNPVMSIGSATVNTGRKKKVKASRIKKIRINVDREIAYNLVDSIGATLLDAQNGVVPQQKVAAPVAPVAAEEAPKAE